jgi:hypothetical protein
MKKAATLFFEDCGGSGAQKNQRATKLPAHRPHHNPIKPRIKSAIVTLAIWGVLPIDSATKLIRLLKLAAE